MFSLINRLLSVFSAACPPGGGHAGLSGLHTSDPF